MLRIRSLFLLLLMAATNAWAQESVYHIGVDGLACPFCAYGIEKQLHKLAGVEQVETELQQGRVVVRVQDGQTLEKKQVKTAVEKAGFSLRSFDKAEQKETP